MEGDEFYTFLTPNLLASMHLILGRMQIAEAGMQQFFLWHTVLTYIL